MRLYIDSSVLISGIISESGASRVILNLVKDRKLTGIISENIISEVKSHLQKIQINEPQFTEFISQSGLIIRKRVKPEECVDMDILIEKEDIHVVAGAFMTKCTHLVSLDKKYILNEIVKKKIKEIRICSPKELLEELVR